MKTNSKNILVINDLPGYGKVALAAMFPILSHMGHSVYNLPTALVSNTLDYGKFTILDTTDYMQDAIAVWNELGFSFDCITTGFLVSAKQVDLIRDFIQTQTNKELLVMTDPIMGDNGSLYNGVTEETIDHMRRLIGISHIMVPNLTEAQLLSGKYIGEETLSHTQAREIIASLRELGAKSVVITSGKETESMQHLIWGYDAKNDEFFHVPYQYIGAHFPGTGDIFSAVLVGELLNEKPLKQAIERAATVLERIIFMERDEPEKNKGIRIERFLDVLNH